MSPPTLSLGIDCQPLTVARLVGGILISNYDRINREVEARRATWRRSLNTWWHNADLWIDPGDFSSSTEAAALANVASAARRASLRTLIRRAAQSHPYLRPLRERFADRRIPLQEWELPTPVQQVNLTSR